MVLELKRRLFPLLITAITALLMAGCATKAPEYRPPAAQVIDKIVVHKAAHKMIVYQGNKLLREFDVALGWGGLAPKERQGDGLVPEGLYIIDTRNPQSAFHLSLRISYPTPEQVRSAFAQGVNPGGDIMIHGLPNGRGAVGSDHRRVDWTDGCIAVTNEEIEWLWERVPDGTTIEIRP
jgi:murein L,D-transpeptidase YafK